MKNFAILFRMRVTLQDAIKLLNTGEIIAMKTDTVYGFLAKFNVETTIEKIFLLKNRPREKSLIVLLNSKETAYKYVSDLPPKAVELMETFWPGPLTLVLPANKATLPSFLLSHDNTIALRVPNHKPLQSLLEEVGPLVAPSANLSGNPTARTREEIELFFSPSFPVFEGEGTTQSLPSTLLTYRNGLWSILREGSIPKETLKEFLSFYME